MIDARHATPTLLRRLRALAAGEERIALLTLPAPIAAPLSAFTIALPGLRGELLWEPVGGPGLAGIGVCAAIDLPAAASTGERLGRLRASARALFRRIDGAPDASPPRLHGGLAFADGDPGVRWRGFGGGRFVLPRWSYVCDGAGARLTLAVAGSELARPVARDRLVDEHLAILAALSTGPAPLPDGPASIEELPPTDFERSVAAVLAAIRDGRVRKAVLARITRVARSQTIDAASVLARLEPSGATRFALRAGDAAFVGATPERLIRRDGARIATEALAGSARAGEGDPKASDKELREHAFVVDAIRDQLAPWCRSLAIPAGPERLALRHGVHLRTPITGELDGRRSVLDLVAALHPTPAVGGSPRAAALALIAAVEPDPRGLYAAPFGWCDARGDGEFVVALRSALLRGRLAEVFAGAGIVAGSSAAGEYAETGWKQRGMLEALGARPGAA